MMRAKELVRKLKVLVVYVFLFHSIKTLCDIFIPNFHVGNLIRGYLLGIFFQRSGRRVAIASGCIINSAWKMSVGDGSYIAHGCWINAAGGLDIGKGVVVSPNVVIATTSHAREEGRVSVRRSFSSPILIGDGTWIASNSVVTKGVRIGSGVVVGAGSVVVDELLDNGFYAGNPARLIKGLG